MRAAERSSAGGGAVAVIPVVGTIVHRAGGMDTPVEIDMAWSRWK